MIRNGLGVCQSEVAFNTLGGSVWVGSGSVQCTLTYYDNLKGLLKPHFESHKHRLLLGVLHSLGLLSRLRARVQICGLTNVVHM